MVGYCQYHLAIGHHVDAQVADEGQKCKKQLVQILKICWWSHVALSQMQQNHSEVHSVSQKLEVHGVEHIN